ncbi:S8 family serine peptidase [Bacillaceae bacterium S4-13-56]
MKAAQPQSLLHKIIILALIITSVSLAPQTKQAETDDENSWIIETDRNPHEVKKDIENYVQGVEVIQVFDTLLQAVAVKGNQQSLDKIIMQAGARASVHPVHTYQALPTAKSTNRKSKSSTLTDDKEINKSIPFILGTDDQLFPYEFPYTGKGVKVGVIDTGIDHKHPDLRKNYRGGYDLVDLDDDPMETKEPEGLATLHGTHVAGVIGANGDMKGIAPDVSLYSYRALGPGGSGTSVQVIAAIEKAVKDGMDIINLSLGSNVNGPDWPTSKAINKAAEMGVIPVVANGNSGPAPWTVGSPATASHSIAVGASTPELTTPFLYDSFHNKKIPIVPMMGSIPWDLTQRHPIVEMKDLKNTTSLSNKKSDQQKTNALTHQATHNTNENHATARGKIILDERNDIPFQEKAEQARAKGAVALLVANNEPGQLFQGSLTEPVDIPVAGITMEDGRWLKENIIDQKQWIGTKERTSQDELADFSSRGPVTTNWDIKPDILAPGVAIMSTVPNEGYEALQGTSMASPHIAGIMALLKEAHPDWTNTELKAALLTTAKPITDKNGDPLSPSQQGMGKVSPAEAINTKTLITSTKLSFGRIMKPTETRSHTMTIQNKANVTQTYTFKSPPLEKGVQWKLPLPVTLGPGEKREIEVSFRVHTSQAAKGIHEGWLKVESVPTERTASRGGDSENNSDKKRKADSTVDRKTFQLPYFFIVKDANFPRITALEWMRNPLEQDEYKYKIYVAEDVEELTIDLYDPNTLEFKRTLLTDGDLEAGLIEGSLSTHEAGEPGIYLAVIQAKTAFGYSSYEGTIQIE